MFREDGKNRKGKMARKKEGRNKRERKRNLEGELKKETNRQKRIESIGELYI